MALGLAILVLSAPTAPGASAATRTASDPAVLKIVGATKPGSTTTVVLHVARPGKITLAYGYFRRPCASTYLAANAAHIKDYRNGGFGNYDANLRPGVHTFKAEWVPNEANWYVCAFLYNDATQSTTAWATFHWR